MADDSGADGGGKRGILPWGLTSDVLKPNSVQSLTQHKLKAFTLGKTNPVKKANPLSKKKELEQQKEEESKEVAKAFEEFDDFFKQSSKSAKTFIRGTTINPNASVEPSASKSSSTKQTGHLYRPTSKFAKEEEEEEEETASPQPPSITPVTKKPPKKKGTEKKKSILELFREELKRSQELRKERHVKRAKTRGEGGGGGEGREREEEEEEGGRGEGGHDNLPLLGPEPLPDPADLEPFKVEEYKDLTKGSFDTGDPLTTNLYVGNINPKMNEEMLCQTFGKFGSLASVKVMWPRTEEERARNKNCGFVAYMTREDADKALETMKGTTIMGYEVQIGWGKSVPLPPHPIYTPPDMEEEKSSKVPDPPSGLPFNAQSQSKVSESRYGSVPPPGATREEEEDFEKVLMSSLVKVVIPTDLELLRIVHRMIEFVIREGPMFEAMVMNKEMSNPLFQFLFDNQCPAHIYYRWKLFSILNGDSPETWKIDEFRMFEGGSLWKPPPLKNLLSKVLPPIQEVVKKGQLSAKHRDYLEDGLRSLTMERDSVCKLMMWCMDHSDSAEEIMECVCESLCIEETPLPMKLARLYLMNDVLHNCTSYVYNSSAFRRGFEGKLVMIMEHFHSILKSISSRIRAEQFKRCVLTCMRAWDTMSVYHFNLVDKLRETFIGKTQEEAEKKRAFQTVAMLMQPEGGGMEHDPVSGREGVVERDMERDLDGVPLLESEPIDFSRTGGGLTVPVDMATEGGGGANLDGDPMEEDLDGVPLADDDIDGVPLEKENIDGVPLEGEAPANQGVKSKWELVDYGDDSSEEEDKGLVGGRGGDDEAALREKERQQLLAEIDEKKRKILREVEVKVMELSDALESAGSYSRAEISERLQRYRDRLMQESVEPSRSPRQQSVRKSRSPSPSTLAKYSLHTSPKSSPKQPDGQTPDTKQHLSSPSPSPPPRKRSHSPSHKRSKRSTSRSPVRKRSKSKSPVTKRARSKSPKRKKSRSRSPRKRSRSPKRHRSKSPHSHTHRHRSRSPSSSSHHRSSKKSKRRSRSRSPHKSSKSSSKRSRH